ncbi:PfaD family polyunsaturated fatty acid/polyketide biosynthesis protein [Candidatus Endolissoclinum faulkneri]|nr:PfaD family polyunsaturated fatty acid/polyketide biosynthesis protein [Candidatus Endolissoclinum faulkneri]
MSITICPNALGDSNFLADHGVRLAYVVGGMVKAIGSKAIVERMASAKLLSFFGAGGMSASAIEETVSGLAAKLGTELPWGVNFLHNFVLPEAEEVVVDILLNHNVRRVEASAFIIPTPALARWRLLGLSVAPDGAIRRQHQVMAKLSRGEVARSFLAPVEPEIVANLLSRGDINDEQAKLAELVPLCDDIVVEADSGGHTDKRVALALLPAIRRQRDDIVQRFKPASNVRIGLAGGLGSPEAIAAAFMLGADFVMTGSINQATVEAGTSDLAKDMLQKVGPQDCDMAPAGDMFEIGTKIQVLRRGSMFAARGNRLYELYRSLDSLDQIPQRERKEIEEKCMGRSLEEVWKETASYYARVAPNELEEAEVNPKKKMAMVFRWYFIHSNRLTLEGDSSKKSNFQIHCGPAMAACNAWLAGTSIENWRQRHVDDIADKLMTEASSYILHKITTWENNAIVDSSITSPGQQNL